MIGKTLLHYEVTAKLGAGGMGEVYRATDTKLGREVAIKVLPSEVAGDTERLARFRREATLLAALNHTHVAAIHGLEESDGSPFLVLELVEGEDLAERLQRGPVPIGEALEIARQIAEALEEAHEKGIVHRDLKPANVKLTPDGNVKVLDFGLARAFAEDAGADAAASDFTRSPTLAHSGTAAGVILGTASYMAPEQASGRPMDKRADIWAFGVVVFEMLTGRRLFGGETVSEVLASVIKDEPDWPRLPRATPPALRTLLQRCLAKNPRLRLRDIGDARLELAAAVAEPAEAPASAQRPPARRAVPWLLVAGLLLALAGVLASRTGAPPSLRPMTRTSIVLPADAPLAPPGSFFLAMGRPSLALAPDGSVLVYVAWVDEVRRLYRRDMRTGELGPMTGTDDAQGPFFSPDGRWVGFFAQNKLKKVQVEGGEPEVLADAVWGYGGDWGEDGFIYFGPTEQKGIHRVPAIGGAVEPVTRLAPGDFLHGWPATIPGTADLFVTRINGFFDAIGVSSVGSAEPPRVVVQRAAAGRYAPSGHLVFAQPGRLLAASFDREAAGVTGAPSVILDDVRTESNGAPQVTWSDDGMLVYAPGSDVAAGRFVWVGRDGSRDPIGLPRARYGAFSVSPDGASLAYADAEEGRLWLYDLERRGAPQVLAAPGQGVEGWNAPTWETDGRALYAIGSGSEGAATFRIDVAGRRTAAEVIPPAIVAHAASPEGLFYSSGEAIVHIPRDPGGGSLQANQSRSLVTSSGQVSFPSPSPNGHWLAYLSDESGSWEIYVTSLPDAAVTKRVSFAGGEEPRWSPDGREIIYRFGSRWYSVAFADEPELTLGQPTLLFEGPYVNVPSYSWDISPVGQRFLVIENPDAGRPLTELVVVHHFFDELRRLTGEGGQ